MVLLKSAIFYVAVTLEAFIFCFVGEYLSAKVRVQYFILYAMLYSFMTELAQFNTFYSSFSIFLALLKYLGSFEQLLHSKSSNSDKIDKFLSLILRYFFQSKSIGDAVYESLWYNMTPAECRILLFVILRSQKRLTITAGNIMDLSLEGFTTVRILPLLNVC